MNGFGLELLLMPAQKQFPILRSISVCMCVCVCVCVCIYIYISFKILDKTTALTGHS